LSASKSETRRPGRACRPPFSTRVQENTAGSSSCTGPEEMDRKQEKGKKSPKSLHKRSNSDRLSREQRRYRANEVVTMFGRGQLLHRRRDGISVVQLRFGTAYLLTSNSPSVKMDKRTKYHTIDSRGGVESQRKHNMMKNFLRIDRQLAKNISKFKHRSSTSTAVTKKLRVVHLTRGGYYVRTKIGPIQVGMPPETVKDSLSKGLTLPTNFVVPRDRFDQDNGLNLAEFEFPAYYNFFILRNKINLITTKEIAQNIRVIFQETLLGPKVIKPPERYSEACPKEAYPDLAKELSFFRINPFTGQSLEIASIIQFTFFDENGIATLGKDASVTIEDKGDRFLFRENGKQIANLCSSIFSHPPESFEGQQKIQPVRHHPRQSVVLRAPVSKKLPTLPPAHSPRNISSLSRNSSERKSVFISGRRLSSGDGVPVTGFTPPYFGITMLGNSHGFDQNGTTTGFVVWLNRRGIMVDPPPYSSKYLRLYGIAPTLIREVILTHCHADHDAGAFQKILEEHRVTLMTTPVIYASFMRKYTAISGFPQEFLQRLFVFRPVIIGEKIPLHGGFLRFFYSLHSIPCVGLEAHYGGKSLVYSGDTLNHGPSIKKLFERGLISEERKKQLLNFPWHHDVILHEMGVPPIHTPADTLKDLDAKIKERLYVVHVAKKSLKPEWGLKVAEVGPQKSIRILSESDPKMHWIEMLELIEGVEIFEDLGLEKSSTLLQTCRRRSVRKGTIIATEGERSDYCSVIAMGFVTASVELRPVKLLMVCDTFGEIPALFDKPNEATMTALTDVELIEFPAESLRWVLRDTPALSVLRNLTKIQEEQSWQAMMANDCLSQWSSLKLRQMQASMHIDDFEKDRTVWAAGDEATMAVLVVCGRFAYTDVDQIHPFQRGAFIGEFSKLMGEDFAMILPEKANGSSQAAASADKKLAGAAEARAREPAKLETTLVCIENGSCLVVKRDGLARFFDKNPGAMLAFINRTFFE